MGEKKKKRKRKKRTLVFPTVAADWMLNVRQGTGTMLFLLFFSSPTTIIIIISVSQQEKTHSGLTFPSLN